MHVVACGSKLHRLPVLHVLPVAARVSSMTLPGVPGYRYHDKGSEDFPGMSPEGFATTGVTIHIILKGG